MRILFVMLNPAYVRHYEGPIRLLAERGHRIHVAFSDPRKESDNRLAERLADECPRVTLGPAPRRGDAWSGLARAVRGSIDALRYLDPRYAHAEKLRERALVWPAGPALRPVAPLLRRRPRLSRALRRGLALLEQAIPSSRAIERFIRSYGFDAVLVTPLVDLASTQVDWVKSARALGRPVGLCVASWDNLTNKGLIRVEPDRVVVWNEIQKVEAVELHGVCPSKVVVTGAQGFDEWFERRPSTTRDAFRARAGLATDRPFLLYVCSSPFIAPSEVAFVERWLDHLRSARRPELAAVGVLIRPHPQNAAQWHGVDLSRFGNVAVWPPGGAFPLDAASKADYFDSLHHCAAVVGINTSALIEAAIVGRPVHTILAPELAGVQGGTLHFRYLLADHGGPLHVARGFAEHLAQLDVTVGGGVAEAERARRFIELFVRPHGLDRPCAPIVADAIEELLGLRDLEPERPPVWSYAARLLLFPPAYLGTIVWRSRVRGKVDAALAAPAGPMGGIR
jgi:hypothetical protein